MTDPITILVVEDEVDIANLVAYNLRREGFEVVLAHDGHTALEVAADQRPPVILLDLMLPDLSGTEICTRLRGRPENQDAYIIMVTARTEEDDRISGFEVGADDYVTKPFSVRELVMRVKAAARRYSNAAEKSVDQRSDSLVIGPMRIDTGAHRVWVDDGELDLTATEYRLLVHLVDRAGQLCTRGELLEEVWELPPTLNTRTVDTHIKRLRQKIGSAASYIETVRGSGYRYRESDR